MKILAIDPSGSFKYGSGTTGWCIMETENFEVLDLGNIKAKNYATKEEYFEAHIKLLHESIKDYGVSSIVIENFILYKGSAATMLNKELETSELIGYINGVANSMNIKIYRQNAQEIKTIVSKSDIILNILNHRKEQFVFKRTKTDRQQWYRDGKRVSGHVMDAVKHATLFANKISREKREK